MSNWERPDHLRIKDVKYLESEGLLLQNIRQAYYLQVGQVILRVKRKFERDSERDMWLGEWIESYTEFTAKKGYNFARIAETAEKFPALAKATETHAFSVVHEIRLLPEDFMVPFLELIKEGETVSKELVREVTQDPHVNLARLRDKTESMMVTLLRMEEGVTSNQKGNYTKTEDRLNELLLQYEKSREEVRLLNSDLSEKEIILNYFKTREKEARLKLEAATKDPEAKQRRLAAAKVVKLNQSVDCIVSTLPQFTSILDDLGQENLDLLENKLRTLHNALQSHKETRTEAAL